MHRTQIFSIWIALWLLPCSLLAEPEPSEAPPAATEAAQPAQPTIAFTDPLLIKECKKAFREDFIDEDLINGLYQEYTDGAGNNCLFTKDWLQKMGDDQYQCPVLKDSDVFLAYRQEWRTMCTTGQVDDLAMLYRAAFHFRYQRFADEFRKFKEPVDRSIMVQAQKNRARAYNVTPGLYYDEKKSWMLEGTRTDVNYEVFEKLARLKGNDSIQFFTLAWEEQKGLGAPWITYGDKCFNVTTFNWTKGYLRYVENPPRFSMNFKTTPSQYTGSLYVYFFESRIWRILSFFENDLDGNHYPCQCVSKEQMVQILTEVEQAMKAHPILDSMGKEIHHMYPAALEGLQKTLTALKEDKRYFETYQPERCSPEIISSWGWYIN